MKLSTFNFHVLKLILIISNLLFSNVRLMKSTFELETTSSWVWVKDTWVVDDDGPADFSSIQEAIDAANPGDTILVKAGTYYEHVVIDKALKLVGENKNTTIIDGNGTGTVILIGKDNVTVAGFTIRNAGRKWGAPPTPGYPDSCILGSLVSQVRIKNNTFAGAAVCAWFAYSSFINISENVFFNATYAGIIGYSSSYVTVYSNLVYDCGWMGIHLDGGSHNCKIANNTVLDNMEGIEIELSAENIIEENCLINNNVSIVLNRCGSLNVFRKNNMTSPQYNLIIFGYSLDSFMQNIDNSNTVNNKTVYYLTNLRNTIVEPSSYPNLGYLGVVNCTNIKVRGFDVYRNGDGVMLAYSTNCTLSSMTSSGNRGPLLCGGLTFYKSNNNTITNNEISNNTCGVCLYRSDGNIFYHNNLTCNNLQVIPDFLSPFTNESSGHFSVNVWDNGLEGNYWGDYTGEDENKDGIGDSPYLVTSSPTTPPEFKQYDNHPLMGMFHDYDVSYITPGCQVTIISNSTISGFDVGVWVEHPEIKRIEFDVAGETGIGFCRICIPHQLISPPYIVVIDNGETPILYINDTLYSNGTHTWMYFTYPHTTHKIVIIPEFPSSSAALIFMVTSLVAAITVKKKKRLCDLHLT